MDNPDDPALQDECANRLLAYAARRRAALTRPRSQTFSTPARRLEAVSLRTHQSAQRWEPDRARP